jgi:hypothetical protein
MCIRIKWRSNITLENVYENMLTHVHKVIYKMVSTFASVLRGREKWRLPQGHLRIWSLEVTGGQPQGHLRVRSVQVEACAKELSERTMAVVHWRVRCIFAR